MIGTVIKHEFHRTRGLLAATFGIDALVALVGAAMALTRLPLLAPLGQSMGLTAAFAIIPAVLLGLVGEHYRSSFRQQGYLTHAVPVPGGKLFRVKFWYGLAWTLLSVAVAALWGIVVAVVMARAEGRPASSVFDAIGSSWRQVVDGVPAWLLVGLFLSVVGMLVTYLATFYFAAAVGSEGRFAGRGLGPLLTFAALYVVLQLVMFLSIVLVPYGLDLTASPTAIREVNFVQMMRDGTQLPVLPLGFLPVVALAWIPLLWRTAASWNRKVSLP